MIVRFSRATAGAALADVLGLPLLELAKVGAAGVSVLVLALSFWLLQQREAAAARPVPVGQRMPKAPDTKPIYALMLLGFISAVLLVLATLFVPSREPSQPDLSHLISQVRAANAAAKNIRVQATEGREFFNDYVNFPKPLTANKVGSAVSVVVNAASGISEQLDGIERELSKVSRVVPPAAQP